MLLHRLFLLLALIIAGTRIVAADSLELQPALLGNAKTSLINTIDPQRLIKKGQQSGVVEFTCGITSWGYPGFILTYGSTPDSQALSQELIDQFDRSRLIPARYHNRPVPALVDGTLVFVVRDGHPHLRIFLNQDKEHLERMDDFIAPQMIFPPTHDFIWFDAWQYRIKSGIVAMKLTVDTSGKVTNATVVREYPPGQGYGDAVMKRINAADFTPAFQNGHPTIAAATWKVPFEAYGTGKQWLQ